jgi:hypothetical protein
MTIVISGGGDCIVTASLIDTGARRKSESHVLHALVLRITCIISFVLGKKAEGNTISFLHGM